jgi:hypothetical protein
MNKPLFRENESGVLSVRNWVPSAKLQGRVSPNLSRSLLARERRVLPEPATPFTQAARQQCHAGRQEDWRGPEFLFGAFSCKRKRVLQEFE